MNESRVKTVEEARKAFLTQAHIIADYWAKLPDLTPQRRCDGVVFSMLNIFDGTDASLPAMDISLRPHPDDKEYSKEEERNWYEDGMVINDDCHLHELYYDR